MTFSPTNKKEAVSITKTASKYSYTKDCLIQCFTVFGA